jgi:hypothetical protein
VSASPAAWRPVIGRVSGGLQLQANGTRLRLAGVAVMGVPGGDSFAAGYATGSGVFSIEQSQYANRGLICSVARSWGANAIRLRFDSTDIAAQKWGWSTADYLRCIVDWVQAAEANGMYVMLCDWSAFEDPPQGHDLDTWPAYLPDAAFPVYAEILDALRLPDGSHDPYVFWEPINEPTNVSWAHWLTGFKSIVEFFRTSGYTGVLVCDGLDGSSLWSPNHFGRLADFDAGLLSGPSQIAFSNHDYALTSRPAEFESVRWHDQVLASIYGVSITPAEIVSSGYANQYVRFESEFGNDVPGIGGNPEWATGAAAFFASLYETLSGYAGAFAWVWGPWSDANAITAEDNVTPSSPWGETVRSFLGSAAATPIPPRLTDPA